MSNSDSFIEEVSEEVRRDRMSRLLRKYGWLGILAVVIIVGGAAFNEYRKAQNIAAAQAFGDGLYDALEASSDQTRRLALEELPAPEGGAAVKALLTASQGVGEPAEAAALLQSVIADPAAADIYKDLARLHLALLGEAGGSAADRRALLDVLILGSGPFRLLALEQRALLDIEAGATEAALDTLQEVLRSAGGTLAQQQRVAQLIVALGGDVSLAEG